MPKPRPKPTEPDPPAPKNPLAQFHPAVSQWFQDQFGDPTPPQQLGWPVIASGQNALIVAPTGSGKTLAAFLAALDHLWRTPRQEKGVRILYISPLKALNQDVWRNLQFPLEGILETSKRINQPLAPLTVAVRSGDTPQQERARILRKPPDILITTPESLHLMLTSKARNTLTGISHVILDEIHAVCGNKRGVFLSLLLERLEALTPASFVRIGLSATQRPLDEVARYLGGLEVNQTTAIPTPRPVTIIDAGWRRNLDLEVLWPAEIDRPLAPGTIWPAIERQITKMVQEHRSTIVFTNNRRTVEKLTARLNESALAAAEHLIDIEANQTDIPTAEDQDPAHRPFRAHHGSLSLDERRSTEEALKNGELAAVIATASLELGIDMGAVDLVCQVESPGSVARGLQRVGRAGHVVRGISKGRLIAKTSADLLEAAALTRSMLRGEIEHLHVPRGCLDVLAQQVIACVAVERWNVTDLFNLVRRAYPFHNLPAAAFESVLLLISGRFPTADFRDLRARVVWDRIHNTLAALPGTAQLALVGGGTIPDTGQYPVHLGEDGPRLGEIDEEFVYERRVGEAFMLGNAAWRIEAIQPHRVIVARAQGDSAVMPFWRGENAARSPELGEAVGALTREITSKLDDAEILPWLEQECRLAPTAARFLRNYVARQHRMASAVPSDQTILIESFPDPTGELAIAVLSPFGGKLHLGLKLALAARLRRRLGLTPACLHANDGLLFRLPNMDEPPLDILDGLTGDEAEQLIREELPDTALFGLRFRQNASRALLMPRPDPSKRTPLWLQRLRAKDLLQVARQFADFPVLIETYRECLDDDLDLPRLRALLNDIQSGKVRVVRRQAELPSPFANELIFLFTAANIYSWDEPKRADRQPASSVVNADLLDPLLKSGTPNDWLDQEAINRVDRRLRHTGHPPRTAEEMAESLRLLGDLTLDELAGPMPTLLAELASQHRALKIELPATANPTRWISGEEASLYSTAFPDASSSDAPTCERDPSPSDAPPCKGGVGGGSDDRQRVPNTPTTSEARTSIIHRYLQTHALVGLTDITARYPISPAEATDFLEQAETQGRAIRLADPTDPTATRWADGSNLAEIRRTTVAVKRQETVAVAPELFADFLLRRHHLHPSTRGQSAADLEPILEQLQGLPFSPDFWETEIFPRRIKDYRPSWLDDLLARGAWLWRGSRTGRDELRVAFSPRDLPYLPDKPSTEEETPLTPDETTILDHLTRQGAAFATDLARTTSIDPSRVRSALASLMARGLITNDRFDPVRQGADSALHALTKAAADRRDGQSLRLRARQSLRARPEGRWSRIQPDASDDPETQLLAAAAILLERYGVLTRDLLNLDPTAPPWSALAPLLARAEWRGEIRRGYFVEGLAGAQYATQDAATELARMANQPTPTAQSQLVLVSTLDPANLYGAGAPFDVELLDGGAARLPRQPGNLLILRQGRPLLIIEAHGKRLTTLPWATETDLSEALTLLPTLATPTRRVVKVETINSTPAIEHPIAPLLLVQGFVRDYPALTYYAGWNA